jgi:hypothetical protein
MKSVTNRCAGDTDRRTNLLLLQELTRCDLPADDEFAYIGINPFPGRRGPCAP